MIVDTSFFQGNIKIDKNGVWYYRGTEMSRKDIVNLFYRHLKKDETGRYLIEIGKDRCYPDVDDTPFVIKSVYRSFSEEKGEDAIYLLMPDDTLEKLDPSTLRIGDDNILYCKVFVSNFEARFSRASYYQLAEYIEQDIERDLYYISLNGQSYYLKRKD
jgi:hypothetical protein